MTHHTTSASASAEQLYRHAEALKPELRAQNAETEARRWIGDALSRKLNDGGFYRLWLPQRYGGPELNAQDAMRITTKIGEGCASSAWVTGIHNAAVWVASLYSVKAQDEVFRGDKPVVVSGVLWPHGRMNKVDGGYRITGKWGFASGVLDATWLLMGSACYDETGTRTSDASYALVPISQIKVYDDWNTMGLSGTASHSVEVKDVFVPDHRILDPVAASSGSYPSDYAHERPLYRSAFLPVVAVVLVPPALGAARAMLETFIAQVPKRRIAYTTYDKQIESVVTQTKLAEAAILIDEAQYHLERCCADIDRWAETKDYMDYDGRVRGRVDIGRALDLCRDAANLLLSISGGAGIASANPLQRYFREIHSCTVHALLLPTVQYEIYGKHLLHQPQITPFI